MPYSRAQLSDTILDYVCIPMAAWMGWTDWAEHCSPDLEVSALPRAWY